jgi:hypothetical protein
MEWAKPLPRTHLLFVFIRSLFGLHIVFDVSRSLLQEEFDLNLQKRKAKIMIFTGYGL